MPLKIIEGDITKFAGDAIFNSVGVETDNYGGICKSIVDAADSKELEKQLLKVKNVYELGDHFVTDGYKLSAKHIVHIIVPYYDNDKSCVLYKKAINLALSDCSKRGFKTIGIPLLGSGANKYPSDLALNTLKTACNVFLLNKDISIEIILMPKEGKDKNRERLKRIVDENGNYHSEDIIKQFGKETSHFKEHDVFSEFKTIDLKILNNANSFQDYIETFITKTKRDDKAFKDRINRFLGYGSSSTKKAAIVGSNRYSEICATSTIAKETALKIIFALKMNIEEANHFLNFFGYSFSSPNLNNQDKVFSELLNSKTYDIVDIDNALKAKGFVPLFSKNK